MTETVHVTDPVEKNVWLFKKDSATQTYWVGYEIKSDELIISDFEMSDVLEKSWHDSDLEHYVHIKREHVSDFISACCDAYELDSVSNPLSDADIKNVLHAAFEGKRRAIFDVKDILKQNDIPYDFQVW